MTFKTVRRTFRCILGHDWRVYQHNVRADEGYPNQPVFVLAFKVCKRCAKSKLIHILE